MVQHTRRSLSLASCLFISLCTSCVFLTSVAYADTLSQKDAETTREDAQDVYKNAVEMFKKRQWSEAATLFEKAYTLDPDATLAYNTGRAHEYTGSLSLAETWYVKALSAQPSSSLKLILLSSIERISNVREAIKKDQEAKPGLIEISSNPIGAEIWVDGKRIGETPYQGAFPSGTFALELRRDGYSTHRENIRLEGGKEVIVSTTLERNRLWTWVTLGLGVTSLAGGVWSGISAQSALDELETPESKRLPDATFEERRQDGENLATLSVVLYSVGTVATLSSIALYFLETEDSDEKPRESVRILPSLVPGGVGTDLVWSF